MKKIIIILIFFLCLFKLSAQTDTRGVKVTRTKDTTVLTGTVYAVIVGVSNYKYVHPLSFADRDALLFKEFLQSKAGGSVKADNIFLAINQDANASTQPRIINWLTKTKKIQKGDRVYFYFAGHGDAINPDECFFLLQDCNPGGDKNNYTGGMASVIQMYIIKSTIKYDLINKGVEVLLIWDACRSNELPGGEGGLKNIQDGIVEKTDGESIMLSTSAGKVALENSNYAHGHGLFTYYLIDGLSGAADNPSNLGNGDGKVDIGELARWVTAKVEIDAKTKFNIDQTPRFVYNGDETLSIVDSGFENEWAMDKMSGSDLALNYKRTARGLGSTVQGTDSMIVELYNKFMAAVKADSLDAGQNSAEELYKQLLNKYPDNSLTDQAGFNLAMEYINLAQEKINLYLGGKDDLTLLAAPKANDENHNTLDQALIISSGKNYGKNAQYLYRALDLLKKDAVSDVNFMKQLEAKADFLSARSYVGNEGLITDFSKAQQLAKTAMSIQPQAAYNYLLFGSLYYIHKQYDSSIYYERKALALAPKWVNALNNLGLTFEAENKYDSAQFYYRKAIAINPDYLSPYGNLSYNFSSRQLYDSAYKYSSEAIALNPLYTGGYNSLGIIFHFQKMYDSASFYYYKTISMDPKYTSAYNNLGLLFSNENQIDSAKKYFRKAISIDSLYTDAYYDLGFLFSDHKQYDSAKYYYRKVLRINPKYTDAYNNMGIIFFNQKQYDSAMNYYFKALSIDREYTYAYYNLGVLSLAKKKYDSAKYYYDKTISIDPKYANAYSGLGSTFLNEKQYDSSEIYYKKVLSIDSGHADAYYNLGLLFFKQKINDSAKYYLQKSLKMDPKYANVYNGLGNIFLNDKQYDSARIYYNKAISLDSLLKDAYYNLGYFFILQNRNDSAKFYYQKALAIDPEYTNAYNGLGNIFFNDRQFDSAGIYFSKAISTDPEYVDAYYNLGLLFFNKNQDDSAKNYYLIAIKLDPGYVKAYYALGLISLWQYQPSSAKNYFYKTIGIDPKYVNSYYELGLLFLNQNQYDSAIKYFKETLKLDPGFIDGYNGLGNVLKIEKKYDSAQSYFYKAVGIDPKNTFALNNLGNIFLNKKQYDSAGIYYRRTIGVDPKYTDAYDNLGLVSFYQNRYDSVAYFLEKIIEDKIPNQSTFVITDFVSGKYAENKLYNKELDLTRLLYNYDSVCKVAGVDSSYKKLLIFNLGFACLFSGNRAAGKYYLQKAGYLSYYYYNVACISSLDKKTKEALGNLENSFQKGYKDYEHIQKDTDLDNIRNTEEFKQLLKKYFPDVPGN